MDTEKVSLMETAEPYGKDIRYLVGIGASAGGVEALQELFSHMPVDTNASFIVVQHLSPNAVSMMDQILRKSTAMEVKLAEEGERPLPNHIYLNVPGKTLTIVNGHLHLDAAESQNHLYLPINILFQSLASAQGAHSAAIVLSGSGSDGSVGIGSVKESGGLVIVQKPNEAQYASMPQCCITTGLVDLVLDVAQIGDALQSYLKNPHIREIHENTQDNLELAEDYARILNAISLYSGIDFTKYKTNTIYRRIERRIALNKFHGMSEYLDYLLSFEEEREALYRDLLIGVTSFFRDEEAFRCLGERVIIPLIRKRKPIRIWSIACSAGQEAYSLAILLCECMDRLKINVDVKIFATDVDQTAITTAQKGIYPDNLFDGMDQNIINRYFESTNGGCMVGEKIRKMIVFAKHDIFKDAPFSRLNLIVCRNMFIYVKSDVQQNTIASFFHLLADDDSYLFLGSSESVGELDDAYSLIDKKWRIYSKNKNYTASASLTYPMINLSGALAVEQGEKNSWAGAIKRKYRPSAISDKLLAAIAGPSILIDEDRKVMQIIQGGGQYMRLQDGQFDGSLESIFSPSLSILINHLLTDVKKSLVTRLEKRVVGLADYPNESLFVRIHYLDIPEGEFYLLQIQAEKHTAPEIIVDSVDLRELKDQRIQELERRLKESEWNLRLAVEESESRNEELQATNEELLASNEELQSTNEEMQSVNEELYTINAEYQNKIVELTTANADFDNLLLNADVGALYIDGNMCIRKITPIMLHHTNLRITDLERPVTQINFLDSYPDFIKDITRVSKQNEIIEREITDDDNVIWLVRIRPYYDHSNTPGGVLVSMFDITKRLEKAKFELKNLTDSIPGGVLRLRFDNALIIEYANDSFFDMVGYHAEEMRHDFHNCFDRLLQNEEWEALETEIRHADSNGGVLKTEFRLRRKGGKSQWCSLQAVVFQMDRRIELQCIVTDISLIKEYEEQMRLERDYYNSLYENVVCGIMQYEIMDDSLRCCSMNEEAVRILGFASEEDFKRQSRQTLPELTFPEDVEYIRKKLLSLKDVGESAGFEHRIINRKDGTHWITGTAKVIQTPDGRRLIQNTFMDTSEKKHALEEVVAERDRYDKLYKMLYHTAVCGIIQVDIEGEKILSTNRVALDLIGEPDKKQIESCLFSREPATQYQKSLARIGNFMRMMKQAGEKRDIRLTLERKDQSSVIIEGTASRILEDAGEGIIQFTFIDVTERERLKEAQLDLAVAIQSNSAKTKFLSKMSHEIRTPMNGIMGMIDIAKLNLQSGEKVSECLDKMKLSMKHLQMLVNDVLDMSKIESGKMEVKAVPFNIRELLSEIIEEYGFSASKNNIGLTQVTSFDHDSVVSDPLFIREILGNLISNAIKFSEPMGIVALTAKEESLKEGMSQYTFSVRDNGCGISEENQKVIFDAFEQGSGSESGKIPGTGLGLSICKNLIELLGGTLRVESTVGNGSEFFFTIPMKIAHQDAVGKEVKPLQKSDKTFEGKMILLAEDNELNAEIAETLLCSYHFGVERVENGEEAVKTFLEKPDYYYDLILMDIQMPIMDGLAAARKIRTSKHRQSLTIPIIAMSANAFGEDIQRSLSAGMNAHTTKPIEIEKLVALLENYLKEAQQRK
ncbi:chemotaxis protein CheB [Clostridium transplantifaecale]|uniref:chemotaxis protein CheB n=1 Tax=Clostridium transplantifaecale TaxID=2479838 RepID=UPI001FA956D4|nr:chemotaxis protein CheB [Clostridium transplantifaecale]